MSDIQIIHGNNQDVLKNFPDNHFHAIVTDSPYGYKFMGKKWDYSVPSIEQWQEALRVLKPGGFLLSFGGTRTYHRMVVNIEDAGFEIREQLMWMYGQGFPKSLSVDKAIDKHLGAIRPTEPKMVGDINNARLCGKDVSPRVERQVAVNIPETEEAKTWTGWGTALKPMVEPICMARKPLETGLTVAENILKWGTGGINIDGCRIETDDIIENPSRGAESAISKGRFGDSQAQETHQTSGQKLGRFPGNVILDEEAAALLDEQSGILTTGAMKKPYEYKNNGFSMGKPSGSTKSIHEANRGGASRFMYCAKPSKSEKNKGIENIAALKAAIEKYGIEFLDGREKIEETDEPTINNHPTIKPISLLRWLVKLVCCPGGIILDLFNGTGTTGIACKLEGMDYVGIEMEEENCVISKYRIDAWEPEPEIPPQLDLFA